MAASSLPLSAVQYTTSEGMLEIMLSLHIHVVCLQSNLSISISILYIALRFNCQLLPLFTAGSVDSGQALLGPVSTGAPPLGRVVNGYQGNLSVIRPCT